MARIIDAEPIEKELQRSIDYLKSQVDKMGCMDFANSMAAMCTLRSILRDAPTICNGCEKIGGNKDED